MTDLDDAPTRTRRPRVEAHTDLDDGRQPPQDLAAEQSVLGGMLLSKDAIADVLEKLRPGDFYRPNHQQIYDAILDLFGHGEPADAVTVAAELDRRGLLRRIGGAPYLHTLIATVPTAANAGYYAGIVAEKAVLRRLVEAGTRVVQYGYAGAEGGRRRRGRRPRPGRDLRRHRATAAARTWWRWRTCCSRPWTRSTRSSPAAANLWGFRPGSPNSTR